MDVDVERYGRVRSRHPVSNRGIVGAVAVLAALGAAAIVIEVVFKPPGTTVTSTPTYELRTSGPGGFLLLVEWFTLLPIPIFVAVMLRRGPKAYFEVREHGLVWGSAWHIRGRPWEQVRALDVRGRGELAAIPLWTSLGLQYRCVVVFTDGKRVCFRGNTSRCRMLEKQLWKHCPAAVRLRADEQRWLRFRFGWLAIGLALLAVDLVGAQYLSNADYSEDGPIGLFISGIVAVLVVAIIFLSVYMHASDLARAGKVPFRRRLFRAISKIVAPASHNARNRRSSGHRRS